jgi:hypothetical protein
MSSAIPLCFSQNGWLLNGGKTPHAKYRKELQFPTSKAGFVLQRPKKSAILRNLKQSPFPSDKMPDLYTKNYYFEFDNGVVTYRHLTTTPDSEAIQHNMVKGDVDVVRRAILQELFGVSEVSSLSSASLQFIRLPRHPGVQLTQKKAEKTKKQLFFPLPPPPKTFFHQPRRQDSFFPRPETVFYFFRFGLPYRRKVGFGRVFCFPWEAFVAPRAESSASPQGMPFQRSKVVS